MDKITIPTKNLEIKTNGDTTILNFKNENEIVINLDSNTMIKSNKKLFFVSEEEMGFISNSNIHLESIDSKIFLNSRQCSIIKDTSEAIEFRKKMEDEKNINDKILIAHIQDKEKFEKRISELEECILLLNDSISRISKTLTAVGEKICRE